MRGLVATADLTVDLRELAVALGRAVIDDVLERIQSSFPISAVESWIRRRQEKRAAHMFVLPFCVPRRSIANVQWAARNQDLELIRK